MQKKAKKVLLQFVDVKNGSCYGKQKLKKKFSHGKDKEEYSGICQHDCRLKEACINASRENTEAVEAELAKIPYNPMIGDTQKEFKNEKRLVAGSVDDFIDRFLAKYNISPDVTPAFREVVYQFLLQMRQVPKLTILLMEKALGNMSQSEYARRLGVTRQAIGAGISTELAGVMRMKVKLPPELTPLEKAVYELLYVDGCTIRSAAKQLGLNETKIFRVKQKISSKLSKSETRKIRKNKKSQKKKFKKGKDDGN